MFQGDHTATQELEAVVLRDTTYPFPILGQITLMPRVAMSWIVSHCIFFVRCPSDVPLYHFREGDPPLKLQNNFQAQTMEIMASGGNQWPSSEPLYSLRALDLWYTYYVIGLEGGDCKRSPYTRFWRFKGWEGFKNMINIHGVLHDIK